MIQQSSIALNQSPVVNAFNYGEVARLFDLLRKIFDIAITQSGMEETRPPASVVIALLSGRIVLGSKIRFFPSKDSRNKSEASAMDDLNWMLGHPTCLSSLGYCGNPNKGKFVKPSGAAIRGKDFIFVLNSSMHFLDESVLIVLALKLQQISAEELTGVRISDVGNKRWRELFEACSYLKGF